MPGIFISYRRNESAGQAGRLFDRLTARFGDDRVFMDVDTLGPSDHYAAKIDKAIADADVVLVLIGPQWVAGIDRLQKADDFIRREILVALQFERRLVPVRLDEAVFPDASDLPEELRPLLASEGAVLRHGEFIRDADHLADSLAFVRPSPQLAGRCLSAALVRAGAPLSWGARLVQRSSPRAALAIVAAPIVVVWALAGAGAYWLGHQGEPDDFARIDTADRAVRKTAGHLRGIVTDETDRNVEGATVTLRNVDMELSSHARTDSDGEFYIAYEDVQATNESRLELEVAKPSFTTVREAFLGTVLRYRRSIKHETEVAHAR
jgi:hypothetical protein